MNGQIEKSFDRLKRITLNDANEQSERSAYEIKEKIDKALEKTRKEYSERAEKIKKTAIAKIERETRAEILRADADARRELAEYREMLVNGIFEAAEKKLSEYMKTDGYNEWLVKNAEKAIEECGEGCDLIEANEADKGKLTGFGIPVETADIKGGVRAVNRKCGIISDYSVDSMIAEKRKNFLSRSGLKIEI